MQKKTLQETSDDFGVTDCFAVLRTVSQTVCPTVVSTVLDLQERMVCWCGKQELERASDGDAKAATMTLD